MSNPVLPTLARSRLRRSAALNSLALMPVLIGGSLMLARGLPSGHWFTVKVLALYGFSLVWLFRFLPDHLPRERLFPANQVTLIRLGLTALLAGYLGAPAAAAGWMPSLLAALVLLLDGVDGWLARHGGWASDFGARFDMETDALLILVMAALVWIGGQAGPWILLAGVMRYLFVAAAAVWPWLKQALPPSRRRKRVCVLQVLTLLLALTPVIQPPASQLLAATGLILLCYSFVADVIWLRRNKRV